MLIPARKGVSVVRRLCVPAAVLAAVLLLAGCGGGGTNDGGMPTPAGGSDDSTSTTGTPTPGASASKPTAAPTRTAASPKRQVIVDPGKFGGNPAVQGLMRMYPIYFRALVARDDKIVRNTFPGFFYADAAIGINEAKRNGWVMRPPGSIVVVGTEQQPYGVVRLKTCRSQTTQYWNPKTRRWVKLTPKGSPEVYDMVETGLGWMMYRLVTQIPRPYSCATVRYPA
jgi:hypothetical protein